MAKYKLPSEVFVYLADIVDGELIWGLVTDIQDIPEDANGAEVGKYALSSKHNFRVRRGLE
jgi:hypothetical protein